MTRRKFRLGAIVTALLSMAAAPAFAASSDPFLGPEIDMETELIARAVIVGCRLGSGGTVLPTYLAPDFAATGSSDKLDVTVKLYVEWILDTNYSIEPQYFDPPVAIDDEEFDGIFDLTAMQVTQLDQAMSGRYVPCPNNSGLAAPTLYSYPLNSSGELTIQDRFGGVGSETVIELLDYTEDEFRVDWRLIYVGWNHPGTWFDDEVGDDSDYYPGDFYLKRVDFLGSPTFYSYIPMQVVEWVSADIATFSGGSNPSPRVVDSSDIGAYSSLGTGAVRWGFESESPASSPTFHGDVTPFSTSQGAIDGSDTAQMASDFSKTCSTGKTTEENYTETLAVMAWFGYAPTNEPVMIGPGQTAPGFELVDNEQRLIGIQNPEGWRNNFVTGVKKVTWSDTKQLYR